MIDLNEVPWSKKDKRYIAVKSLELDRFEHKDDLDHDYGIYTLNMRKRCSEWLENEDPIIAANALLISIRKACALITGQMYKIADEFVQKVVNLHYSRSNLFFDFPLL